MHIKNILIFIYLSFLTVLDLKFLAGLTVLLGYITAYFEIKKIIIILKLNKLGKHPPDNLLKFPMKSNDLTKSHQKSA